MLEDLLMAARHTSLQSGRWCALAILARAVSLFFFFGHVCAVAPADGLSVLNSLYGCCCFIYKAGRKPVSRKINLSSAVSNNRSARIPCSCLLFDSVLVVRFNNWFFGSRCFR
jgi:hypothetical protein